MDVGLEKKLIAKRLQEQINRMQGLGKLSSEPTKRELLPFASAFPNQVFPTSCIHEFISGNPSDSAATSGFMTALAGKLIKDGGLCLWVGNDVKIYPAALLHFGLQPDRIVFIQAQKLQDVLWIIEEALKCDALSMVVGEIREIGFTESRRLQLAVERSGIVGFIHRQNFRGENASACTARWKITPKPSVSDDGLPGIGYSAWNIQLLKVKNGKPDSWQIIWSTNQFLEVPEKAIEVSFNRNVI